MTKGVTIISEVLIAIVVLTMTVILALMASGVIGTQISTIIGTAESGLIQELRFNVEKVESSDGSIRISYEPSVDSYTLQTDGRQVQVSSSGRVGQITTTNSIFQDTNIQDADELCITKNNSLISINEGACDTPDKDEICEDGCDPMVCLPEWESCDTSGCDCSYDTSGEASGICGPGYNPGYIESNTGPVTEFGCVNKEYVGKQGEGERCEEEFECGSGLKCGEGSNTDKSYCCPQGQVFDGDRCADVKTYDIVYVPVNYNSSEYSSYQERARNFHSDYVNRSPFEPDSIGISKNIGDGLQDDCELNISGGWTDLGPRESWTNSYAELTSCADRIYGDADWDLVVGICNYNDPCTSGGLAGRAAGIPAEGVVIDTYASEEVLNMDAARVSTHEIGHAQGLWHVSNDEVEDACDNLPQDGCNPNGQTNDCQNGFNTADYTMTYCTFSEGPSNDIVFGPQAQQNLEQFLSVYLDQ